MTFCHGARERISSYTSVKSVTATLGWCARQVWVTDMNFSVAMGTYQCLFFRDERVGYGKTSGPTGTSQLRRL